MFAGILHDPNQTTVYWFKVPQKLAPYVRIGAEVHCDTRRGTQKGNIVSLIDGMTEEQIKPLIGDHTPMKHITAVMTDLDMNSIHVPWSLVNTNPNPSKIEKRVKEFYRRGMFDTEVRFTDSGALMDGYTAYLVAKMFGHDTLRGLIIATL